VDDCSTDDSVKNIRALIAGKNNFTLIENTVNKGVNYSRNRGIERATGTFLLFLDSDDFLTSAQSLEQVKASITAHPAYRHYLFLVSDREKDTSLPDSIHEYQYKDWITGKAGGDYVHVISPDCFDQMPFLEEFRIYESLNWLRVLRANEKQLYVPITITTRDRGRDDSVTKETRLLNTLAQKTQYDFLERHLDWYAGDYEKYGMQHKLNARVNKAVLLGIALGENEKNKKIIDTYVPDGYKKLFFRSLNTRLLQQIAARAIRLKSTYIKKPTDNK
jgi:glycosyltransferase involved in cell wall biosynthesis